MLAGARSGERHQRQVNCRHANAATVVLDCILRRMLQVLKQRARFHRIVADSPHDLALLRIQLGKGVVFVAVARHQLVNVHWLAILAAARRTVRPSDGLLSHGGRVVWIHCDNARCKLQVEARPPYLVSHQQRLAVRFGTKRAQRLAAVFVGQLAVVVHRPNAALSQHFVQQHE